MPKSKLAVLVVEDVPQVRATAVRIMQDLGCEVFDAYNGHQALKLLQAHPEIEDRGHDAVRFDGAGARLSRPGHDLQQRRLARAVFADQTERLPP